MPSRREGLVHRVVARDQAVLSCDLYRAVTGHFNRITLLSGAVGEYRDDGAFGVIAERLVDLVANREFAGHQKSLDHRLCAQSGLSVAILRLVRRSTIALPTY
jgi:hypothetical protein